MLLAIVEGLTEYLPISSTGHMIITSSLLGIQENPFVKDYTIIVQFGAILSVVFLYWRRFLTHWSFYKKLFVAFLPAALIGLAVKKKIDLILGDVSIVAWALIVGGIVLLFVDRWFEKSSRQIPIPQLTYKNSLLIGLSQCLAFIPGVSRAAATMIGGLWQGLDRKSAAEFSFFLAVPTLTAATAVKCVKILPTIQNEQIGLLIAGNLVSFVVGAITIRTFIGYLSQKGLRIFGYYRIAVGVLILILLSMGHSLQVL